LAPLPIPWRRSEFSVRVQHPRLHAAFRVEAVREALLTHETIDAIIVAELLPDVDGQRTELFVKDLADGLGRYFGNFQLAVVQWRPKDTTRRSRAG
jgi:hypothetical protein